MTSTLTFLGTGTSQGIPMIGCSCHVCQSADNKDKRLRTSALIEHKGFKIVIDCGPDFRQQMLRENIKDIDAVLLTHQHKDHTGGMDDIRAFNYFRQKKFEAAAADMNASLGTNLKSEMLSNEIDFPIYAESRVQDGLMKEYHYAFESHKYPGVPDFKLITINEKPFDVIKYNPDGSIDKLPVTPIRVMHYKLPILGFRFDNLAYITDGSAIPECEFEKLKGLDVLIINTVRHQKHISHFSLSEAIDVIKRVGAKRNYLTHLSHQIGTHQELVSELNEIFNQSAIADDCECMVLPAYDGLKINF